MNHIVFDASSWGSVKYVLKELGLHQKEEVLGFWENFSVGPIWLLHEEEGVKARFKWMENCISYEFDEYHDYTYKFHRAMDEINSIPAGSHAAIWVSDNAHEQTGLRFAVHLLKEKNVDISVINTAEEFKRLFPNKKNRYTPLNTGEISIEKLQTIYEHGQGRYLTDHDREHYEKEWRSLAESRETLRIWRNGTIHCLPEDYYDEYIIKRAKRLHGKQTTKEFMKSARLIGEVIGHLDQYVGDGFIEYRVKKLIEAGIFDSEGSLEAMRFYSVRLRV